MSFLKTASVVSACLFASVSIASAEEVRLSADQLDTITAGSITPIEIGSLTGESRLEGLLTPPPPVPEPPTMPNGPELPDPVNYIRNLLQGYLGGLFPNSSV